MQLADDMECVVPTDVAVKGTTLNCTIPDSYVDVAAAWTSIATWLTALATVALVVAAIWAGRIAVRTLRQMETDSRAQTRPYLYACLVPSLAGGSKYDLLIENTGASTAREVKVSCPDFPIEPDDVAEKLKFFLDATHTLPPKVRIRNFWRLELAEGQYWSSGGKAPAGMPEQGTIVLEYLDDSGASYIDTFQVEKKSLAFAPMPERGHNVNEDLSKEQQDTHKMLAVIATVIGELRR